MPDTCGYLESEKRRGKGLRMGAPRLAQRSGYSVRSPTNSTGPVGAPVGEPPSGSSDTARPLVSLGSVFLLSAVSLSEAITPRDPGGPSFFSAHNSSDWSDVRATFFSGWKDRCR